MKHAALAHQIVGSTFGFYSPDDIRKISVKKIDSVQTFDALGNPVKNGLYDPALGPMDSKHGNCTTCGLSEAECPGHFGHIELPVPIYNPIVFSPLLKLIKLVCFNCHKFRIESKKTKRFAELLHLINCGKLDVARELENFEEKNPEDYATDKKKNSSQKSADIKFLVDRLKTLEDFDLDLSSEDVLREQVTKNMLNYRKELVIKYLKAIPTEKCHNCGAFKIALKKDGLKLFQKRLSETNARLMGAQGITYRSPLSNAQDDNADDDTSKWLFNQPKESENMEVLEEDPMDVDDDKDARKKKSKKSKKTKKGKEEKDEDDPEGEETDEKGKKKKKAKKDEEATNTIRKARGKKLNPADDVTQRLMSPLEVREHMKLLWNNEQEIIKLIYSSLVKDTEGAKTRISSHDIFFLEVIAVPPTRFRPPAEHNGQLTEHAQNVYLSKVLNIINQMEIYKKQGTNVKVGAYTDLWNQLQNSIQLMMDNTPGPANKNPPGIKQLLEKKEGLFRKNMMGKRVDFAARSVISPDPYIETNEIGVPLYFAKTLNYPEPVTAHNVAWLRKLVMNGPLKHPGANKIEDEFGNVIVLPPHDDARRAGFAKTLTKPNISSQYGFGVKKVYRHLMDGDFLLVNRQPTLHKPSIMAHKARILGLENTIQMHYANCNTYNADFDGDEMNLHFPQSELSRAEASQIVITDQQYVVPKDGSPLRGLIQDHIVSGVYLTCRDTFLTRDRFQQLFFGCCWNTNPKVPLTMPTPAVLKPQRLWTGKQLITAVLNQLTHGKRPLNLVSKSQIPDEMWGKGSGEATIIIRQNHLLTGVLGKKQFGNKAHGLVHAVYELYGAEMAGKLLTTLGRLFTLYLQFRGFTCGMDDLLLTLPAEKKRAALAEESSRCGMKQAGIFTGIIPQDDPDMLDKIKDKAERRAMEQKIMTRLSEMLASPDEAHNWDKFMISHLGGVTSSIIEACLPHGQVKAFPKNNLAMMTISGAKGSRVNFSQISCLLGQQELEGRRVPRMVTGQTLPCFAPYDTSPLAGGFVANRFLTGVNPVEYFFHCMAGREGLIDTAVKTSRSGYLQRCIIKHMESLTVSYDHTVRDHDGSVIQFYYGDDGIDVMKTGFLYEFDFLSENMHILMDSYDIKRAATLPLVSKKDKKRAMKKKDHYDPVLNKYSPGVYLGAVSEKFENAILNYIEKNPEKFSKTPNKHQIDPDMFRQMMYLKYIHSLANPGEAVGVLAGQSIGEPSTQMTLNTFHLAGKGEVNVTLGIPRMRELILTGGSTTTTPSMILPLKKECGLKEAQNVAARLARSMLIEVLDDIVVKESLDTVNSGHVRVYDINVTFKDIDKKSYSWRFFKNVMEQKILPNFLRKISEILKIKKGQIIGKSDMSNFDEEIIKDIQGAADDEAAPRGQKEKGGNDDDGYSSIQRSKKKDFATYDEADDDEKEMVGKQDEDEEFDDVDEEDDKKQDQDGKDEENNNSNEENIEDKKMNQKMSHECLKSYSFSNKEHSLSMVLHVPADKPKLLIVSLLEEIAEISAVRAVKNIKRCFVIKPNKDDSRYKIQTEGINFESIWRLSNLVEMKDIYTNHVPTIAATYGIEAARASMVSEIGSVFKAYGITVDPRHLALVGDSMCFEGVIKAMNRGGINSNTSPYLKMSFETTMAFLTDAAIHGDYDRIESPSAQITLGRLSRTGTGAFDVRHDLTYLERHKPKA